jgi:phage/plasmid-associated DNA primase
VLAATQAYREGMDVLAGFLSEHCLQENEVEVEVGLLYAKYVQWAEGAGVRRLARNVFGTQMHGQLYANPNMCPLL